MGGTPDPVADTGKDRPADPALGEVAVAHAILAKGPMTEVHPTEADLTAFRTEQAERNNNQAKLNRRLSRTDKQLAFLYALLIVAFGLLAYRSQAQDAKIRDGLHDACVSRVAAAEKYNQGREALIAAVLAGPNAPTDPAARDAAARQLRDGLLLPLEDCGGTPS